MDFTYGDLQVEMDMINRAYIEVMTEGDASGRVFTFPIPTYNITDDFPWESENATRLFEMTAKYGLPYFQNFINSELDPGMIRSMCCRLQLDLRELLNQNFLVYDGTGPVPEQIHSYLSSNWKDLRNLGKDAPALVAKATDRWYVPDPSKAGDLERLRERALLREFEEYKQRTNKFKRNETFRLEAVRAGFKKAWQNRDYDVIVNVAEKIPPKILEEDPKLLMWYDQAVTRMGGESK